MVEDDPTSRDKTRIKFVHVVDEPIVLAKAFQFLQDRTHNLLQYVGDTIKNNGFDNEYNGFETYMCAFLTMQFSTWRTLDQVFKFAEAPITKAGKPDWHNKKARLVAFYRDETDTVQSSYVNYDANAGPLQGTSFSIGRNAMHDDEILNWLQFRYRQPFCFPRNEMGPNIMCCLALEDGSVIWVAVEAMLQSQVGKLINFDLIKAARRVTPDAYFSVGPSLRIGIHLKLIVLCRKNVLS